MSDIGDLKDLLDEYAEAEHIAARSELLADFDKANAVREKIDAAIALRRETCDRITGRPPMSDETPKKYTTEEDVINAERGIFGGWTPPAEQRVAERIARLAEKEHAPCASCGRPFVEHGPPHDFAPNTPSCPPPSLTGIWRPPMRSEPRMSDERVAEPMSEGIARLRLALEERPDEDTPDHLAALAALDRIADRFTRSRGDAALGAALREAVATVPDFMELVLIRTPSRVEAFVGWDVQAETDATRHLASLLSALPVVEDAADHREEER